MSPSVRQLVTMILALAVVAGIVAVPFVVGPAFQAPLTGASGAGGASGQAAGGEPGTGPASQSPGSDPTVATSPGPAASGSPDPTGTPVPGPSAVLIAAGDIAACDRNGDDETAALVATMPGTVAALGDTAYPSGTAEDFAACYDPTWGRFKDRTRPVPGTHDYDTDGAAGYFDYFGKAAGPRDLGYYSYDLGAWHIVALNTNCREFKDGCGPDSAQARWLRQDLEANNGRCTLAYGFGPRFSSGRHGSDERLVPLVQILYEERVSVLVSAHDHHYERFEPLDPEGYPDADRGIRQFVVGTGGHSLRRVETTAPGSEVHSARTFGVLRLQLEPDRYHWEFVASGKGGFRDSGTSLCTAAQPEP